MIEMIVSLCFFALVSTITPGPNNALLLTSGLNHGLYKSLPLITGVIIGLISTLVICLLLYSQVSLLLTKGVVFGKCFAVIWLIHFSYKFLNQLCDAQTSIPTKITRKVKKSSFFYGFSFQWINPKTLINSLACASSFGQIGNNIIQTGLIISVVFLIFATISCLFWTSLGLKLESLMKGSYRYLVAVIFIMMMAYSIYSIITI